MGVEKRLRLPEQRRLDFLERGRHSGVHPIQRNRPPAAADPGDEDHLPLGEVAGPQLDPQRHPPHLPVIELPPGRDLGAVVQPDPDREGQPAGERPRCRQHLLAGLAGEDRHDDDLNRGDLGRQHKPPVVAVDHDEAAEHPPADAP